MRHTTRAACLLFAVGALLLGGVSPDQPRPVTASGETDPPAVNSTPEAPAVLVNPSDPGSSLVLGVSQRVGLRVYSLTGELLQQIDVRDLVGIDTRSGVKVNARRIDLAACIDTSGVLTFYLAGPGRAIEPIAGSVRTGVANPTAVALHQTPNATLFAFIGGKALIEGWRLTIDHDVRAERVYEWRMPEDVLCLAASDSLEVLYVGDAKGLRSISIPARGTSDVRSVKAAGTQGVRAIGVFESGVLAGHLLLSTSGGLTLHSPGEHAPIGKAIEIQGNAGIDQVESPGLIGVADGSLGPAFPFGLLAVGDASNAPGRPNLKLIDLTPLAELARRGR